MAKSKKVEKVESETFYKTLEVKLTDDEIRIKGQELARAEMCKTTHDNDVFEKKSELKKYESEKKPMIEEQQAKIIEMTKQINNGTEPREIECFWKYNHPEDGLKTLIIFADKAEACEVEMEEQEKSDLFINGKDKE